jgi:hypothetical protein
MNERIRELMIQSNPNGDFSESEWVFEKFATLIVRECALQCVHNEDMDLIEKHFGVEE